MSWSLRIQQEITKNTSLSVGYIGSHGYHELLGIDANEPFPVVCPASPCPSVYPIYLPGRDRAVRRFQRARTSSQPTATKPNPTINNTWTYFSEADSEYNALADRYETSLRGRAGFIRGVYTWSKTIDDGDSLNATTSG